MEAFNGENTLGNWKLEVAVVNTLGTGGSFQGWSVEFCASVTPDHPFLVENETIFVKPNDTQVIHNFELWASDPDDPAAALKVHILGETKFGFISRNGVQLGAGDFFRFTDINNGIITYTNTDPDATDDFFTFSVTDGRGGLFGAPKFNIVIDEDAVTSVDDLSQNNSMNLYPNPVSEQLNVQFNTPLISESTVMITGVQGNVIMQKEISKQTKNVQLNLNDLSDGIYFMTVQSDNEVMTERFVVQH